MTYALGVLFKKSLPGLRLKRLFPLFLPGALWFPVMGFSLASTARVFLGTVGGDPPLLFAFGESGFAAVRERVFFPQCRFLA